MHEESEVVLSGLIRLGTVSDVDETRSMVRLLYQSNGIVSGWLYVLKRGDSWMPKINDTVLALYLPMQDGDGFVLGGV